MQCFTSTSAVHHHDASSGFLDNTCHVFVKTQGADVVHDLGSGLDCVFCNSTTIRIDRYGDLQNTRQCSNHRQHASDLFHLMDGSAAGPAGFAADIDKISPVLFDLLSSCHSHVKVEVLAAI